MYSRDPNYRLVRYSDPEYVPYHQMFSIQMVFLVFKQRLNAEPFARFKKYGI